MTTNRFYLINKPIGISSFDVIRRLRKKFNIKKMGHTGTLDPLASGLILVATGNYTKLIPFLEKAKKTYVYTLDLSGVSESIDLGTEVEYFSETRLNEIKKQTNSELVESLISSYFIGDQSQIPPKYSALKIDGKRAYELAREGKEVEIKSRNIEIFKHSVLEFEFPKITLEAEVSAGTYIRSMAYDIGCELGDGAFVSYLSRTGIDNLTPDLAFDLENIEPENTLDLKHLFDESKFITLDESDTEAIKGGKFLPLKDFMKPSDIYFVLNGQEIISVIECREIEFKAKTNI